MSKPLVTLPTLDDDDVSPPDVEEKKEETKPVASFSFKKRKQAPTNLKQRGRVAGQDNADAEKKDTEAEAQKEEEAAADEAEDQDDEAEEATGSALATAKKLRLAQLNKLKGKTVQKMDKSTSGGLEFSEKSEGRVIANSNVDRNVAVAIEQVKRDPNLPKWKGPMREAANVRAYSRMDYQPDICKDYKETGYCGYGDNCKFMHDRGDYKSGWQLEREWKEEQDRKARMLMGEEVEGEANYEVAEADEFPWKCLICRRDFTNPVVTKCKHYFCEKCALSRYVKDSKCFACKTQTEGVFNTATKLITTIANRKAKGLKPPSGDDDAEAGDATESTEPEPSVQEVQEPIDLDSIFQARRQARQSSLGWAYPNPSAK